MLAERTALAVQPGDIVTRVPYYGEHDHLPLTVTAVLPAKAHGCLIFEGRNANGQNVLVPVGHKMNVVTISVCEACGGSKPVDRSCICFDNGCQ